MAGTFLIGEKKVRPGTYFRRTKVGFNVEGAINGIASCVFQSNWGPLNEEFDVDQTMLNNLGEYYGSGNGVKLIREALRGGATTVRCVRVGGADGTASKIVLKTSDSTPKDAVEITAKYPGSRAFSATVDNDLVTGKRRFRILVGTKVFVQVLFDAGGSASNNKDEATLLVAAMANNRHFTAELKNKGTLADITQTPAAFTAGTNPTVTRADYSVGLNVLERFRWNTVMADSNNKEIKKVLVDFVNLSYETGHLGMAVIAGTSSEPLDSDDTTTPGRIQQAASYNNDKIVYVLNGWIDNAGDTYDGWLVAARIGGMIAACETNASLTHTVISNAMFLIEPLTNGEIIKAEQHGCYVLSLNDSDQVWIDNSINTLVTCDEDQDEGWKKVRRTKCRFELMDRINRTHDKLVGKVNNDANGRATVIAAAQRVINEMCAEGKLVVGSYIELDEAHPPEGDSAWFNLHIRDYDSLEFLYLTYVFAYGQTFDDAA